MILTKTNPIVRTKCPDAVLRPVRMLRDLRIVRFFQREETLQRTNAKIRKLLSEDRSR